jgi:hypothetical protein
MYSGDEKLSFRNPLHLRRYPPPDVDLFGSFAATVSARRFGTRGEAPTETWHLVTHPKPFGED